MSLLLNKGVYMIRNPIHNRLYIGYAKESYLVSFLKYYRNVLENHSKDTELNDFLLEDQTKFSVALPIEGLTVEEEIRRQFAVFTESAWDVKYLPSCFCKHTEVSKRLIKEEHFKMLKYLVKYLRTVDYKDRRLERLHTKIFGDCLLQLNASEATKLEYETFSIDNFTLEEIQEELLCRYKEYLKYVMTLKYV